MSGSNAHERPDGEPASPGPDETAAATGSGTAPVAAGGEPANAPAHGAEADGRPTLVVAEDEEVHVGRDGWLFLVGGSNRVIDLYRRESSFTDELAREWVELLRARADRLEARGIEYVHLAAPEKLTLLHREAAGRLEDPQGSPILRLVALHEAETPNFLNVVPYLASQIDNLRVYWKTDTHWAPWGAYLAYQMLCTRLGIPTNEQLLNYPFTEGELALDLGAKLDPPATENARFYRLGRHARRVYANPLVRYKEARGLVDEPSLHVGSHVVFRNDSPTADPRTVVLFGDSFSEYRNHLLTGMLAETVRELHFIWNASIDDEYVRLVRPDIVVTELAERFMTRVPVDDLDVASVARSRVAAHREGLGEEGRAERDAALRGRGVTPFVERRRLLEPETIALEAPITVQDGCDPSGRETRATSNPVGLVEVHSARVYFSGTRCLVTASNGEVIRRYEVDAERARRVDDEEYVALPGTTLLLADTPGTHCYYHWMLDILPKLGLLERAGIALDSINHFLVREITGAFQLETLARFGIDRSRIVETVRGQYRHCERLLHVELENGANMRMHRFVPGWLQQAFRTELAEPTDEPRLRLYISRPEGVRRGISNEAEMLPHLEAAGFTAVAMEGLSVEDQVRLLARADVVMSPHGGALTNTVFCRPGTKVVELLSRHVYPFYYGLSQVCGHCYHAILENPEEDFERLVNLDTAQRFAAPEIQWRTHDLSFEVSIEALKRMLARL